MKRMDNTKKPGGPMDTAGRDETVVFVEDDPLCAALDNLCLLLDIWKETLKHPWQRKDRAYRRELAEQMRELMRLMLMDEAALEARYREASQQSKEVTA